MRLFAGTEWDNPVHCETCGELESDCACPAPPPPPIPPEKQLLRVRSEKRKHGKTMTVIRDLAETNDHSELLTQLKNHCGTGGTIKENTIEIQGEHTDRAKAFLLAAGYRVKK